MSHTDTTAEADQMFNHQIEGMVIGSMLTSEHGLKAGVELLKEDDFHSPEHRTIFKAIKRLRDDSKAVDIHLVVQKLGVRSLSAIGGVDYLTGLAKSVGESSYVEEHCWAVRERSNLRRALDIESDFRSDVIGGVPLKTAVADCMRRMQQIEPAVESKFLDLLKPVSEDDIANELSKMAPGANVGFQLGEEELILPAGALTIVAGQTGHGKTMVTINLVLNYLERHPDKSVVVFSYEESRASIVSLFLNTYIDKKLSRNNRRSIKSALATKSMQYVDAGAREAFKNGKDAFFSRLMKPGRLRIVYSEATSDELVASIRFLQDKDPSIGLIGVDYLQVLTPVALNSLARHEKLKTVCMQLKDCSISTGLPILLAAQFNREVTQEASIDKTRIGEGGDIERSANLIIGIWNRTETGSLEKGGKPKARDGKAAITESAMYMEVLKGREIGIGHASVYSIDGNTGKMTFKHVVCRPSGNQGQSLPSKATPMAAKNQNSDSRTPFG